jgi:Papain family cysteine protease
VIRQFLIALSMLLTLGACSTSTADRQPSTPKPLQPLQPLQPLRPLPPPSPAAALAALASTAAKQLNQIPCPPPSLPPEIAARIDCSAMRGFADAVAYVPRSVAHAQLPANVDLRAHRLAGPVKDQAMVAACTAFAITSVMENAALRMGRPMFFSPMHVFSKYAARDSHKTHLQNQPLTTEEVWPWDPARACRMDDDPECASYYGVAPLSAGPQMAEDRARADGTGRMRIASFEELATNPLDTSQVALLLASGEALWAALNIDHPLWLAQRGVDMLPYYPKHGAVYSHAVTLEGYRVTPNGRQFLIHNSWGRAWGRDGYIWIDERMLASHANWAYRIRVADASLPTVETAALPNGWPALPAWPNLDGVALPLELERWLPR